LQALALYNDAFMLRESEHFAQRLRASTTAVRSEIIEAYKLALLRSPSERELAVLEAYAEKHGLENLCRVLLNCSEFLFVD